jgi:hypothetical protein
MNDLMMEKMDSMVGRPFVLLPGAPSEFKVAGVSRGGVKIRNGAIEQVWNDALLMDAISGDGSYLRRCRDLEIQVLELAEKAYGMTLASGVQHWLKLPKLKPGDRKVVWPGKVE